MSFAHQIANAKVFENHLVPSHHWAGIFSILCLYTYCFSWYTIDTIDGIASYLVVIFGTYYFLRHGGPIRYNAVALLFIAALIGQLISWSLAINNHPEWADSNPKLNRMGVWFKMIPIAIIMGANTRNILVCWLIALLALLLTPWLLGEGLNELTEVMEGKRIDFGINNAQHTAMLFGTALLGVSALLISCGYSSIKYKYTILTGLVVLSIALLLVTVFAQTRGIWLGLSIGFFALILTGFFTFGTSKKFILTATVSIFILGTIVGSLNKDMFFDRYIKSKNEFEQAYVEKSRITIKNSIGIRTASWNEAWEWIAERPVFGWGGQARKWVVHNADLPKKVTKITNHLHNSYLDTTVNYGLVGLGIYLLLIALLIRMAYQSWHDKVMPDGVFIFVMAFYPYWLLINFFESYMYFSQGEYIFSLVGATILSYYWRSKRNTQLTPNELTS